MNIWRRGSWSTYNFPEPSPFHITVTSKWARWRLKSPASRLFAQLFIPVQIKENIIALRQWPLWGEFTGHRWIPLTKARDAENVSIWWRHHGCVSMRVMTVSMGSEYVLVLINWQCIAWTTDYLIAFCHMTSPGKNTLLIDTIDQHCNLRVVMVLPLPLLELPKVVIMTDCYMSPVMTESAEWQLSPFIAHDCMIGHVVPKYYVHTGQYNIMLLWETLYMYMYGYGSFFVLLLFIRFDMIVVDCWWQHHGLLNRHYRLLNRETGNWISAANA